MHCTLSNSIQRARKRTTGNGVIVWVLLFLVCVLPLAAQEAQPDTYAGFEGEKVAKVDISVKPMVDV